MPVSLHVNGKSHLVDAAPDTPLLYVLRNDLQLNAPKFGCGLSQCGACTVYSSTQGVYQLRGAIAQLLSVPPDNVQVVHIEDIPTLEVVLINHPDQPAWGAGECATLTTGPAVANAIFWATGARVRDIPLTPDRVLAALA